MILTVPNAGMPPHKSAPLPVHPVTSAVRVRAPSARGRILDDALARRAPGWDFVEDRAAADDGFRQQIRSQAGRFAEEQRASRLHGPTERLRYSGEQRAVDCTPHVHACSVAFLGVSGILRGNKFGCV